ncbi:MAG TPA: hypothetical protein VFX15_09635 [Actinomycetes bacterium]|nr:hypothetical protein [Actinomycetes bacterium]
MGSVALFALILFLLSQHQLAALQARELERLSEALRLGNLEQASVIDASNLVSLFPTSVVVQFAVLGLAVIVTARMGRRAIAIALPFVVVVASLAPAYWGDGGLAPQPLGQDDWNLWGSLVSDWVTPYDALPVWPLVLGAAVQTVLLLLPLIAVPKTSAALPAKHVVVRSLIPAAVLAVVALTVVPPTDSAGVYRAPLIAVALTAFVIALLTGIGPASARIAAAIGVPTATAAVVIGNPLDQAFPVWTLTIGTALCASLIVAISYGDTWVRRELRPDEPLADEALVTTS